MLVNRVAFYGITFILMIILLVIKVQPLIAGAITLVVMMTGYIIIALVRSRKRLSILDDACDPEAFIESTEKQRAITGRKNPKFDAYFDIDKAAGLFTLGKFAEAKEILFAIDKSKLSRKYDSLLVYTINLMLCFYELGEITSAEELFETQIPALPPINPRVITTVNVLVAVRFFHLKRYDESREQFNKMLNQKLSKRTCLEITYCLAQIDEEEGNKEAAREKYQKVASEGNKLWIATQAKSKVEK